LCYTLSLHDALPIYLKSAYDGRVSAYYPAFPEGGLARVHFIIGRSGGKTPRIPQNKLEQAVREIATRWTDRFEALSGADGLQLVTDRSYQEDFTPAEAHADLALITTATPENPIRIAFYRKAWNTDLASVELKIFHAGEPVSLSRRVPLLENLGFSVVSEQTHDLTVAGLDGEERRVILHDMELRQRDGQEVN